MSSVNQASVVHRTHLWVKDVVVGLSLCPFAPPVVQGGTLRIVCTAVTSPEQLLEELARQARALMDASPGEVETTLIVHPACLEDFLVYNDFLGDAEDLLQKMGLEGILQVASFHPDYCFADVEPDDPANYTNRSPYPMLHLLREASVTAALEGYDRPESIYERNVARLRGMSRAALRGMIGI